jgi:tRNA pseudouridine synthase 10
VHGDLGRTTPNVGSLLGKEIDILQLDVGSLKEGEWKSGDE